MKNKEKKNSPLSMKQKLDDSLTLNQIEQLQNIDIENASIQ